MCREIHTQLGSDVMKRIPQHAQCTFFLRSPTTGAIAENPQCIARAQRGAQVVENALIVFIDIVVSA